MRFGSWFWFSSGSLFSRTWVLCILLSSKVKRFFAGPRLSCGWINKRFSCLWVNVIASESIKNVLDAASRWLYASGLQRISGHLANWGCNILWFNFYVTKLWRFSGGWCFWCRCTRSARLSDRCRNMQSLKWQCANG